MARGKIQSFGNNLGDGSGSGGEGSTCNASPACGQPRVGCGMGRSLFWLYDCLPMQISWQNSPTTAATVIITVTLLS